MFLSRGGFGGGVDQVGGKVSSKWVDAVWALESVGSWGIKRTKVMAANVGGSGRERVLLRGCRRELAGWSCGLQVVISG